MELAGGRYRITHKLGEGGMGEVYRADDVRLQRAVAIKMIRPAQDTPAARARLWREARAAASVSHPNICQLYEIGEENGSLFIAMELVDGEPLSARLARGALPLGEAVEIGLVMLSALSDLHGHGIVHRDLKPSNIHLTSRGLKLLDFGLARPLKSDIGDPSDPSAAETRPPSTEQGVRVGTPRYMAPEQAAGELVDARADLFAAGVVLHEMLTGTPLFARNNVMQILHAIAYDQPPALVGSPAIAAVDRVIHRALAKRREDRYQSAEAMTMDLRAAGALVQGDDALQVRPMSRLIVLPFRLLRPDAEIEFLAFSLPDALTLSLSNLESLVVRSSLTVRATAAETDVRSIAKEMEVDIVLTGTLLRAGNQLRVAAQLVDARGTLVWSHQAQTTIGDLFQLQDSLAGRIVESLALPLSTREHRRLKGDVPASAKAYEFYLRANQISRGARIWTDVATWAVARDLYLQSIESDGRFAPAWAELGRVFRLMAKASTSLEERDERMARSEAAFVRALELNPDLASAHTFFAQLELPLGRARQALARLLERATYRGSDPDLFAGLCQVSRYCGLLEASLVAHERATRLDPAIVTSVAHTYFCLGDSARVIEYLERKVGSSGYAGLIALAEVGRIDDAIASADRMSQAPAPFRGMVLAARYLIEGKLEASARALDEVVGVQDDPEALFYFARHYARLARTERALRTLEMAIDRGYWCYASLLRDPWFESLRDEPTLQRLLDRLHDANEQIVASFHAAGGPAILGAIPQLPSL